MSTFSNLVSLPIELCFKQTLLTKELVETAIIKQSNPKRRQYSDKEIKVSVKKKER